MIAANRLRANRANARRSTGPKSPLGKANAARNALKAGLFARALVIPALGESAEDFDSFRAAVAADLDAGGVLECELAGRVATVLWRLRRVPAYEAAVTSTTALPPHPDEVKAWAGEMFLPLPPSATTADQLARARTRVRTAGNTAVSASAAAELARRLGLDGDTAISNGEGLAVLDAVAGVIGWDGPAGTDRWAGVLHELGVKPACPFKSRWTLDLLRRVVGHAAGVVGRELGDVIGAAVAALSHKVMSAEENLRHHEGEERSLAERLLTERTEAATRAVYADDAAVQRVARAESHLSRELDRALAAFERVRAVRGGREGGSVDLGSFCETACRG